MPCTGLKPGTSRLWTECATSWAILPNEKLRKNYDTIYLICCSTNICQFDIPFHHCSTHIITHCWTHQVGQFGQPRQHCMVNCGVMMDQNVLQLTSALHKTYYSKHCLLISVENFGVLQKWNLERKWRVSRVSPTTFWSYLLVWMKVPYLILKYSLRVLNSFFSP